MQERFCTCGYKVMVEYLMNISNVIHRLTGRDGSDLRSCPCCGRRLDINALR